MKITGLVTGAVLSLLAGCTPGGHAGAPAPSSAVGASATTRGATANARPPGAAERLGGDWTTFGRAPDREARVDARGADGRPLSVSWSFAAAGAIPLAGPPLGDDMKTTAYTIGLPVGPSLSRGLVLAGSDAGYLYALDAETGALVWSRQLWNMAMVNPVVVGNTVFATTGNPFYNGEEAAKLAAGERATRGPGLNGLYALDLATGAERWHVFTPGQNMPTPVAADGVVYFASGDGLVRAVDAQSGALRWKTDVKANDGMSSLLLVDGRLFFGGSHPDLFVALDARDGKQLWTRAFASPTPAGFGAGTAAFGGGNVLVEELVKTDDALAPVANRLFALAPASGETVWEKELGRGPKPKGFGAATPTVVGGVVYVSSIVDGTTHALDVKDGQTRWTAKVPGAGAGLVVGDRRVYVAAGPRLVALDREDGRLQGTLVVGGHLGPATPLLAGETLIVTNMYGWIQAFPAAAFAAP
jgi:outer membrane protein assembly factor BamB